MSSCISVKLKLVGFDLEYNLSLKLKSPLSRCEGEGAPQIPTLTDTRVGDIKWLSIYMDSHRLLPLCFKTNGRQTVVPLYRPGSNNKEKGAHIKYR